MKRFISVVIGIFFICHVQSQIKSDSSLIVKEIARTSNKSEFLITKGCNKYYVTFAKTGNDKDSLYVAFNLKTKYILQTEIEILDTLELEDVLYNNKVAVLIKTGGNILLNHILILNKKTAKLFERVNI